MSLQPSDAEVSSSDTAAQSADARTSTPDAGGHPTDDATVGRAWSVTTDDPTRAETAFAMMGGAEGYRTLVTRQLARAAAWVGDRLGNRFQSFR